MTNYEMLANKLKNLKDAEDRCNMRGRLTMAMIWRKKAADISALMLAMSVEDAMKNVAISIERAMRLVVL